MMRLSAVPARSLCAAVCALLALPLAACNTYNLRYQAQPQPKNHHVYADFTPLQNAVGFAVDTDGERLEEISIKKADGTLAHPVAVNYPGFGRDGSIFPGVGVGAGHVGVGLGLGIPIGPMRAHGVTSATFQQPDLGPPPWEIHLKIHGIEDTIVPGVGGPPTAK